MHFSHNLHNIKENLMNKNNKTALNEITHKFILHYYDLKSSFIGKILNTINQLEFAYQKFNTINYEIIQLIQVINSNYENYRLNYYLRINVLNIMPFNKKDYVNNDKIESLISFFNQYLILKPTNKKNVNPFSAITINTIHVHFRLC